MVDTRRTNPNHSHCIRLYQCAWDRWHC